MSNTRTRTEYSAKNTGVAVIARILAILMGFFTRIVFTHTLAAEYVGVNGLFTDILNVLALSEMGVGTAITFALYKPIADKDIEKQKSLMRLYRYFYRCVAGVVAVAGLILVPFLPNLMKDEPDIPGLTFIYLMYLANSVLSYFMIYKKTLIEASQQGYVDVLFHTGFLLLQNAIQIVILLTTGNFILFLVTLIVCTLGYNISVSIKAERMFPYLREKSVEPLPVEEKRDVFNNVRSMMMHKIGNVLVNNTDNILLAKLVSSIAVGCYSNYYLVIGSIRQVLNQVFIGITASVGNLGVSEDNEHVRKVYSASALAGMWMYGFAAIMLYLVIDPFIGFCFGKSYVFDPMITAVLCINFYLTGVRQPALVFRDSMGLFKYDRWVSLIEAVVNLLVSILLGIRFGIIGIFLGTMISTFITSFWVEPVIIFKYRLKVTPVYYFAKLFIYTLLTLFMAVVQNKIYTGIQLFNTDIQTGGGLLLAFFLRIVCCTVFTNLLYFLISVKTKAFKTLYSKFLFLLGKRREMLAARSVKAEDESEAPALYEGMTTEEIWVLEAIKSSLTGQVSRRHYEEAPAFDKILQLTLAHSITQLVDNQIREMAEKSEAWTSIDLYKEIQGLNGRMTRRAFQLIYLTKNLAEAFNQAGIRVAVLKGIATARYYDKPERRKSSDVDLLLLDLDRVEDAKKLILSMGCEVKEEQRALHHIVFNYKKTDIPIELHTMMAEPFDNNAMNKYVEELLPECEYHCATVDSFGVKVPALTGAFHAYELLLHMLQHFLRAGFGLKLLCDWVVFWNKEEVSQEEKEIYIRLVTESGIKGFSDTITVLCRDYLGLISEKVLFMDLTAIGKKNVAKDLLKDIFAGEEFGHADNTRMVALRGNSPLDYIREFHHQMRLNHPKSSKIVLFWPVLWVITYVVFVRNNSKIRGTDTMDIYKNAGRRGRIVKAMGLFK